jgi:cell division transport system permease protein
MSRSFNALQLKGDPASLFLTWAIAFLVGLATLTVAIFIIVSEANIAWKGKLWSSVKLQIIPEDNDDVTTIDRKAKLTIEFLGSMPEVQTAEILSQSNIKEILERLGTKDILKSLEKIPLPILIDVTFVGDGPTDFHAIEKELSSRFPWIHRIDNPNWGKGYERFFMVIEEIAVIVLLSILGITIISVSYATQTTLSSHSNIIELLHLMGATNRGIAAQFSDHIFKIGLKGSGLGILIASFILTSIPNMTDWKNPNEWFLPFVPSIPQGSLILGMGLVGALLCMATSNVTIRLKLRRMP